MVITNSCISIPFRGKNAKLNEIPKIPRVNGINPEMQAEQTPVANPPIVAVQTKALSFLMLFFFLYFIWRKTKFTAINIPMIIDSITPKINSVHFIVFR